MQTITHTGQLTLDLLVDGRLLATKDGTSRAVSVRQAFPWSEPRSYISLRDADDEEFAFVPDVTALDPTSRQAMEEALVVAGFVLEITGIREITEEVEVRHWRTSTRQGIRLFQTRLDEWPRALPGGGLLIRDVAGDLYHLPDPGTLDDHSQRELWPYVD